MSNTEQHTQSKNRPLNSSPHSPQSWCVPCWVLGPGVAQGPSSSWSQLLETSLVCSWPTETGPRCWACLLRWGPLTLWSDPVGDVKNKGGKVRLRTISVSYTALKTFCFQVRKTHNHWVILVYKLIMLRLRHPQLKCYHIFKGQPEWYLPLKRLFAQLSFVTTISSSL